MTTLTLEQAYYIGELTGVVVVVLSLLIVAWQLRQNTGAIKSQSISNSILIGQNELLYHGSEAVSQVFLKSINAPETLTLEEIQQLNAWNVLFLIGRFNDFQLYKLGTITEERIKINEPAIQYALQGKWHRNWLKKGGLHFFGKEYIDWIESVLNKTEFDTYLYFNELKLKE